MSSVQTTASRPRQNRTLSTILLVVGALVLAAGISYFAYNKVSSGSSSNTAQHATPVPPKSAKAPVQPKLPPKVHVKYSSLPAQARAAVRTFVLTAVVRKNVGDSWRITTPGLRQGMSKGAWAKGDIPVQYYPVYKFDKSSFHVHAKTSNEIGIFVGLAATPKSGLKATTFDIQLRKFGTGKNVHWKVDYWMPYWTSGMPMAGGGGAGGA